MGRASGRLSPATALARLCLRPLPGRRAARGGCPTQTLPLAQGAGSAAPGRAEPVAVETAGDPRAGTATHARCGPRCRQAAEEPRAAPSPEGEGREDVRPAVGSLLLPGPHLPSPWTAQGLLSPKSRLPHHASCRGAVLAAGWESEAIALAAASKGGDEHPRDIKPCSRARAAAAGSELGWAAGKGTDLAWAGSSTSPALQHPPKHCPRCSLGHKRSRARACGTAWPSCRRSWEPPRPRSSKVCSSLAEPRRPSRTCSRKWPPTESTSQSCYIR